MNQFSALRRPNLPVNQILLQDTQTARTHVNAEAYERQLAAATTPEKAVAIISSSYQSAHRQLGRTLIEFFWLGAAIAKGHAMAGHGDGYFKRLALQIGGSEQTLRGALDFYDLFGGDPVMMAAWLVEAMQSTKKLGIGDVRRLVKANTDRRDYGRGLRRHLAQSEANGVEPTVTTMAEAPALATPERKPSKRTTSHRRLHAGAQTITMLCENLHVRARDGAAGTATYGTFQPDEDGPRYRIKVSLERIEAD